LPHRFFKEKNQALQNLSMHQEQTQQQQALVSGAGNGPLLLEGEYVHGQDASGVMMA
jgi:hypothetical protein